MDHNSDLLRPSLSADHNPSAAIYSVRTAFLTSFFGGPIAGALIALLNSYRLKRLAVDWPIALIAIGLFMLLSWLSAHDGWRWAIYGSRAGNVLFFGIVYAFHRTYYKSMSVLGITPPNGLMAGIGAILLGVLADFAMATAIRP
jgi:hypothetical protein